ncbi:sugar ABC transporter substrate-binding protein [uncultured Paenibacillus sp.]|uniref:ABC transporter substrate-binding protein n=1 Tax=uncultured Paenibacillus sp. TaxID=227322 RepID=UPI0028D678A6|nr:sugar ABC transporter substrate-binding protein [uncultured Paenibacillus sp.]
MKKMTTLSISIILIFSIFLAACGGNNGGAPANTTTGGNAGNAKETNAPAGGETGKKVELTMSAWGNPAELKVYQRALDAFMKENPNTKIKLIPVPGDYEQKIMTELSGGAGPDLFYVGDGLMSKLIENKSIVDLTEFANSELSYAKPDEFAPGLWGPAKVGENIFGMPVDSNPMVLYYNKKLFKDAGLKTPQEYFDEGSWNWETFKMVAETFQSMKKYGFVQENWWGPMLNWIWSNGGEMYDENGNYVMDKNDKAKEALAFVSDLVKGGGVIYSGSLPQGQGQDAMFMSQQVAMVGAGRWLTPMFSENKSLEFDYIPYPTNTGNKTETAAVPAAYLALNANSKNQPEALKVLTYYVSKAGQEARLADTGNAIPSIAGLDYVVTDKGIPEHAQYLLDAREKGVSFGAPRAAAALVPGLGQDIQELYDLMLLGKADPEATIAAITKKVQEKTAEAAK